MVWQLLPPKCREESEVLAELGTAGVALHDAGMRRPTLDDVFLALTGRQTTDAEDPEQEDSR